MEGIKSAAHRWRLILFIVILLAAAILLWDVLRALGMQLLAASMLALPALPLCHLMEKRMKPGWAAALSLLTLVVGEALLTILLLPPLISQMELLASIVPPVLEKIQEMLHGLSTFMESKGMNPVPIRDGLMNQFTGAAGGLVTRAVGMVTMVIGTLGKVVLSPLLAFYLLRDRRKIAAGLTLLLPVTLRARGVRAAREMRRESAAYVRGQLLLSLLVGSLTAIGLLLTGTPGWLLLGVLMGVMELVPYIGPVIAGVPAVLLSLSGGWARALWTLAVLVFIQELEGAVFSPRLVGHATALHPMAVLLLVSAGGMLGGAIGMMLVIPAAVSLRGALRGWRA